MSAGQFERTKYVTDRGQVIPIRLQPETLAATIEGVTNDPPSAGIDVGWPSAKVSGSRNSIGIHARYITCAWTTAPAGYDDRQLFKLVIPQQVLFDSIARDETGTYLGGNFKVVSTTKEEIN